jgi:hypothetical protein
VPRIVFRHENDDYFPGPTCDGDRLPAARSLPGSAAQSVPSSFSTAPSGVAAREDGPATK